jgi:hypothetical protein
MKGGKYRYNGFRTVVLAIQNWDLMGFRNPEGMVWYVFVLMIFNLE